MKKIILLLVILLFISCEKDEGESYSKDLIGNWDGFKTNYVYTIISSISQTVNNPYEAGTGSLILSSAEEATLQYMYLYSINGVLQISISDKPIGVITEEIHYRLKIYDYGDFGTYSQLTKYISDAGENYEGELEFSLIGSELTVTSGALYHTSLNDSITVIGTLSPAQTSVNAGSETELGNVDWTFDTFEWNFNIKDGNSFTQTIITIDSGTIERSGTWEATSDEITFHYSNSSDTYAYSVSGSGLVLEFNKDLCVSNPDECFPLFELEYGMESGSLEQVAQIKTTHFSK
jgi:hypothetical protein